MKNIFLIIILFITSAFTQIQAQCCSAGNPVGSDGISGDTGKGQLQIISSFRHSNSKQYYHEFHSWDDDHIKKSYYDFQNLRLVYGISDKFRVSAELGYFYSKAQLVNIREEEQIINSTGLGDLNTTISYKVYSNFSTRIWLIGGVRIPIGKFDHIQDGVQVPVSLQPSSGAFKYNGSASYIRFSGNKRTALLLEYYFEWTDDIQDSFFDYKYGNFHQLKVGMFNKLTSSLSTTNSIKYEFRAQDKRNSDDVIKSTGSHVIILSPGLKYTIGKKFAIYALGDIPVFKYVNGYQLTNQYAIQIGLTYKLPLIKKEEH